MKEFIRKVASLGIVNMEVCVYSSLGIYLIASTYYDFGSWRFCIGMLIIVVPIMSKNIKNESKDNNKS